MKLKQLAIAVYLAGSFSMTLTTVNVSRLSNQWLISCAPTETPDSSSQQEPPTTKQT